LLQALPRCLVKLPKLSTLIASHNPIAELPGSISKLTGLLDLHMAHCALKAVPQVRVCGPFVLYGLPRLVMV
jgi:Leucine-rich repeat (LRR) protein